MRDQRKSLVSWIQEALQTAAASAILVLALYGLIFVDLTGNGRLCDILRGYYQDRVGVSGTGHSSNAPLLAIHTGRISAGTNLVMLKKPKRNKR
jgi:hypothetical protein